MKRLEVDACVIGGGPAGAAGALRLAKLGYRVCLVERGVKDAAERLESLAPPVIGLLDALGVLGRVQARGFAQSVRTRSHWSADPASRMRQGDWLLVEREAFDAILLRATVEAGVTLVRPGSPARAVSHARGAGWDLDVRVGSELLRIATRYVLEATGRHAGVSAAKHRTVALCGMWRVDSPPAPEMRVEALHTAWVWGAPAGPQRHAALVFVDAGQCAGLTRIARELLYRELLRNSVLLEFCLGGKLDGDVQVRDAACRVAQPIVGERWLRVGDRAFAPDPCSSQGVQMALRGGLQAAAVVHTVLSGGDANAALAFYRTSQDATVARHRRHAAAAYASQDRSQSPFWQIRSQGAPVQREFSGESAKPAAPEARLHLSPEAHIVAQPLLDGDTIRPGRALSHPRLEQPLAWLGGIELVPLLERCREARSAASLLSEWGHQMPQETAARILEWLVRNEVLAPV